ncbi:MAG: hypothetical protein M3004_13565, partial [Bacteroidota bacterium]|nr:hypothetical protein [Bacteroidota bacterium]
MKKIIFFSYLIVVSFHCFPQNKMTPELLWKLGRVSGLGISKDGKSVVYSVATPSVAENKTLRE